MARLGFAPPLSAPPPRQPAKTLDAVYEEARALNEPFQSQVADWARRSGGTHMKVEPKNPDRALQKIARAYQMEFQKLLDVARSTVLFDSVEDPISLAGLFF